MTRSKLTHAEKDEVMAEMQAKLDYREAEYMEHVRKNTMYLSMSNKIIADLKTEVTRFTAINCLLSATIVISSGIDIYYNWRIL
jgi:hypothetical protein